MVGFLFVCLFILFIYLFIYIYILFENLIPPQWGQYALMPRKGRRKKKQGGEKMEEKKDRGTEGKTLYPKLSN